MQRVRAIREQDRGAAAVEFALVAGLLLMLIFASVQLGLAYYRWQGLQAGAREGARLASVGGTQSDVATRVRQAQNGFGGSDIQLSMAYSTDNGSTWSSNFCDDSGSTPCTSSLPPTPCTTAGLGNLLRVTATVQGSTGKYAISIPLVGNMKITFTSSGTFRCEKTG